MKFDRGSLRDLIWKMECKGFDMYEIHIWISSIWMLTGIYIIPPSVTGYKYGFDPSFKKNVELEERLAQAHIEIDFTNFKKNNYGKS